MADLTCPVCGLSFSLIIKNELNSDNNIVLNDHRLRGIYCPCCQNRVTSYDFKEHHEAAMIKPIKQVKPSIDRFSDLDLSEDYEG